MTRIDRSPEQNIAEAEGRSRRADIPVTELIEDHRYLYRADLALPRLHVRDGESGGSRAKLKIRRAWRAREDGTTCSLAGRGWTGMPFSQPFVNYIDWGDPEPPRKSDPELDWHHGVRASSPGRSFPWSQAFYAQWAECRRSHPEHHDRPEWRGSLCYQLVSWTVRHGCSLEAACLVLGVTPPRAGRTLRNALLWIEASIDHQRARQEQREAAAKPQQNFPWRDLPLDERIAYLRKVLADRGEPEPSQERHDQPGLHREDCVKCRKQRGEAA